MRRWDGASGAAAGCSNVRHEKWCCAKALKPRRYRDPILRSRSYGLSSWSSSWRRGLRGRTWPLYEFASGFSLQECKLTQAAQSSLALGHCSVLSATPGIRWISRNKFSHETRKALGRPLTTQNWASKSMPRPRPRDVKTISPVSTRLRCRASIGLLLAQGLALQRTDAYSF
jgi:hypothetical protein